MIRLSHLRGRWTSVLLSLFFLLGATASAFPNRVPAFLSDRLLDEAVPLPENCFVSLLELHGLLFLFGSSLIGFAAIPPLFLLQGAISVFRVCFLLSGGASLRQILFPCGFSALLSLTGLLYTGTLAFDSSLSVYRSINNGPSVWTPMPFSAAAASALYSFLAALVLFLGSP